MRVAIELISVPERRARKDAGDLAELQRSIQEVGLLHPVVVTPDPPNGFKLIAGWRRLMAIKNMGLDEVPVTIVNDLAQFLELSAERDENTARKELTPSELTGLAAEIAALERPKARQRQDATKAQPGERADERGGHVPTTQQEGKVRDIAATAVGSSARSLARATEVIDASENDTYPEIQKVAIAAREMMDATGNIYGAWERLHAVGLRCSTCKITKPDDDFGANKNAKSRRFHTHECRACASDRIGKGSGRSTKERKDGRSSATRATRVERAKLLAKQGYTSRSIAEELGIDIETLRHYKREHGLEVPADKVVNIRRRRVDWNRVVGTTVMQLGTAGDVALDDIDWSALDDTKFDEWIASLKATVQDINKLRRRLEIERSNRGE